jgi:hypothetical protein
VPAATIEPAIDITSPPSGGPVSNPVTAEGEYEPPDAVVTCWIIASDGNQYDGTVSQGPLHSPPLWGATFGPVPDGDATLYARATYNGVPATVNEPITIIC